MESNLKKFLDFNGKSIYFTLEKGEWWIAIKPVCEALKIDFEKQRESIKKNKILGQLPTLRGVVAKDGRLREMVCLPEHFFYGWLFKLQSENPELEEYQYKCYTLLHNYFRGAMAERSVYLKEHTIYQQTKQKIKRKLWTNPDYQELMQLEHDHNKMEKEYKQKEREFVSIQLPIWGLEEVDPSEEETAPQAAIN